MCGIYFSSKLYTSELVQQKLDRIKFRGPDYTSQELIDNSVLLGHNRLAIIDLDARSNQPFHYLNLVVVLNGEIYNFKEIRNNLKQKGYSFATTSDTEVLAAAYHCYGKQCLAHFNGMFAFVIYDKETKSIFAARDRMGKKPFFYRFENNELEISSQPSQIAIGNNLALSEEAIQQFLIFRYIPEPTCIYESIKKLLAGHSLSYTIGANNLQIEKYWEIASESETFKGSYEDALAQLSELCTDSIQLRMMADVPLGCFLSGGIDSTLIAAMAMKVGNEQLKTFSIKFDEPKYDESIFASETATHLGTNHLNITCQLDDGIKLIDSMAIYYDEPFGDSSAIPSMLLCQATKKHVTVALSGDGGDEAFLGYNHFDFIQKAQLLYKTPKSIRVIAANAIQTLPNYKAKTVANYLKFQSMDEFTKKIFELNPQILNSRWKDQQYYDFIFANKETSLLQKAADYNLKLWLVNDSNVKVDRASMSAALEVRSPLLDYRIIEFARTLPMSYRYENGNKKRILKDLAYQYVPKEMLDRPKRGFTMPFELWFRTKLKEYVLDTLTDGNLRKIPDLNIPYVKKGLAKHMKGENNFYPTIWNLLVMINWQKNNRNAP
jgi:asparagine synthase (glutamine-hydrolysing)